ncbi:uncharacterized protein LOC132171523 [Corylus avellana]|uniref:uncharacterized protein LOC132171523 n=1 Tax=Corylus avellana TaxID=13451 RepID=UPI00286BEDFA|nr:uncharacterized protein LOC132171523 [Corylus avellana]
MEVERMSKKVVARMSEQYQAANEKNWEKLKDFCSETGTAAFPITVTGDTALHIAVLHSGSVKLVRKLLEITDIRVTNNRGDTVLHEAAGVGNIEMAELFLDRDEDLIDIKNKRDETPLFRAAAFGKTEMVDFLAERAMDHGTMKNHIRRGGSSILHIAVLSRYFDTAWQLLKIDNSLQSLRDESGMTCLQLLANMPSAFKSGFPMNKWEWLLYHCLPYDGDDLKDELMITSTQREDLEIGCGRCCSRQFNYWIGNTRVFAAISSIYSALWRCIAKGFPYIEKLWEKKRQHKKAEKLANHLALNEYMTCTGTNPGDRPEDDEEGTDKLEDVLPITISYSESPLLSAARNGIIEIVDVILRLYPESIEVINKRDENIFHLAVRYRRKKIFDLLNRLPNPTTSRLRRRFNCDGDSILHQAAYLRERQLNDRPGEALRMQSEIQWFERVRKIVPPHFINHRNKKQQTADELFTSQHKKLMKEGQKWIDQTTKACTIVAVLIATVAYTCAYTTPGGSNSKTGHPLLLKETPFRTFTTSDTLSLCFSLTSVVLFLSIMTSKMDQEDFRRSLPLRLVLGLTTLFLAVASMMVAFAATLVLIVGKRLHSAATPVYTVACCPVALFLVLEFPLYLNIAWYTVRDMRESFIDSLPFGKPKEDKN